LLTPIGAALIVTALWLLFAVTHMGLPLTGLRKRLGGRRFTILFVVIAQLLFALVVLGHGGLKRIGPWTHFHGLAYTRVVGVVATIGMTFVVAGLIDYLGTPMVPLATHTDVTSLQRVTRHPIMLGLSLWGAAWAALPTQWVDVAFFAGFPAVALLGSWHQDRKLAKRRPDYAAYCDETSFVPFAAMLRQRSFKGAPWLLLAVSAPFAYLIEHNRDLVFARFGMPLLLAFIVVSTAFTAVGLHRAPR
jgi:uncharacterized membrane protein